jgi:hypothetical protein
MQGWMMHEVEGVACVSRYMLAGAFGPRLPQATPMLKRRQIHHLISVWQIGALEEATIYAMLLRDLAMVKFHLLEPVELLAGAVVIQSAVNPSPARRALSRFQDGPFVHR